MRESCEATSAALSSLAAPVMALICAFSSISRSRSDPAFSKSCVLQQRPSTRRQHRWMPQIIQGPLWLCFVTKRSQTLWLTMIWLTMIWQETNLCHGSTHGLVLLELITRQQKTDSMNSVAPSSCRFPSYPISIQTTQNFLSFLRTGKSPDGSIFLLEQRAELLVQVPRLLRQLGVPEAHAAARLVDQVDGLVGQESAPAWDSFVRLVSEPQDTDGKWTIRWCRTACSLN